jgi:guanine deaminase
LEEDVAKTDREWMELAMATARQGMDQGQSPFGAVIVKGGELVVAAHNVVWETTDVTAHGEVHAIRLACRKLKRIDLSGCTIYSTTEPCPMCFAAIHWAGIERIVFGAGIGDARAAGFKELTISNEEMKRRGGSAVEIVGGLMRAEAVELFREFVRREGRTY